MSTKKVPRNGEGSNFPHDVPRLGRMSCNEDDVRQWAFQARGQYGVPVRVFERQIAAGGVRERVWVAIIWPKGSGRPREEHER